MIVPLALHPHQHVSVLNFGHSNRCVAVFHYCFHLQFPDDIGVEQFFIYLFAIYLSLVSYMFKSFIFFKIKGFF